MADLMSNATILRVESPCMAMPFTERCWGLLRKKRKTSTAIKYYGNLQKDPKDRKVRLDPV
jgi:hypothetical protein